MANSQYVDDILSAAGMTYAEGRSWLNSASDADMARVQNLATTNLGMTAAQATQAFSDISTPSTLETGLDTLFSGGYGSDPMANIGTNTGTTNTGTSNAGTNTGTNNNVVTGTGLAPLTDNAQLFLDLSGGITRDQGINWLNTADQASVNTIRQNALNYGLTDAEIDAAFSNIRGGTTTVTNPVTKGDLDQLFQPGLYSGSSATSDQSSESYTGLPSGLRDNLLSDLLPQLMESYQNLPGQIDDWTEKNLAASHSASKNLLDGHLTSVLADLAKRGMIDSSAASEGISKAATDVASQQAGLDLTTLAQAAQQKFQIPGMLSSIADLGKYSSSSSTGDSSSTSSNPLEPYQLYSQMLLGLM